MSMRVDGGAAADTPVVIPGLARLAEHGITGTLEPGTQALVIGHPEAAAYAVTGTPADLVLFALRVLATTLSLPQDSALLPGADPDVNITDQLSPAGYLMEWLMDEAEVSDRSEITDVGDVAAVQVKNRAGRFLVACVPVPESP